jgi:uncharacterized pyridoxal phosphate-containing UPF0001 family protein
MNPVIVELPSASKYTYFRNLDIIQNFIDHGGKIFAATESRSTQQIEALLKMGHRHFAEKYFQEAQQKFVFLRSLYPQLHLSYFGKLQTNKIAKILRLFNTVESISRTVEVDLISKEMSKGDVLTQTFFMQWNVGDEDQKNGAREEDLRALLNYCKRRLLPISGLMVIPPKAGNPQFYFTKARDMANELGLERCQMGFSSDYETAIACGSDRLRISRAFFD